MSVVASWPRVYLSSGACEALKWLALLSMCVDHVNKALFDSSLGWAVPIGRLAMPIFSLLIAYNLARPHVDAGKMLRCLVLVGLVATPFHTAINGGGLLPLNVLFTFAVAAAAIALVQARLYLVASAVFLVGGLAVDYLWTGPALVIATWLYFRTNRTEWAVVALAALAAMCLAVGNWWAFLALPVIIAASLYAPYVPRLRWFFWAFYPAHLAMLSALAGFVR